MPDTREVLSRPAPAPDAVLRYDGRPDAVVDVHLPHHAAPAPLLVLLHGGFWRQAYDRTHTRPLGDALRAVGWLVATPEYRRTGGGGGWTATFDDVAALRDGLVGLLHDVLPQQVSDQPATLLGHSAGGHLALWWALTDGSASAPRRTVALAPVADLARAYTEDLGEGAVAELLGGGVQAHPARYAQADPAARIRAGDRPRGDVVLVHGRHDAHVPLRHSRELAAATGLALIEPDCDHFALIDPESDVWPVVASVLGRPPGRRRSRSSRFDSATRAG